MTVDAGLRRLKPWVLVLCATPAVWLWGGAFAGQLGANPAEALIRGLGDWALRLLVLTLWITPLRQTMHWPSLAGWRRGLGLWVFAYALMHLVAYAWLDMGASLPDLWTDVIDRPFIAVGMLALAGLVPLAATSFNAAIRALGARRWKVLHRTVYAVAGLAVLHFYWMRTGKNHYGEVIVWGGLIAAALLWRLHRLWRQRQALKP